MLEDRLQVIAERLAEHLGRSVILDDSAFRPLAISTQLGAVDQSRIDYILQRRTLAPIRQMITDCRVQQSQGPVRIPPNADLGTLPRLVIPILDEGYHHGYLWLIDDPTLTPEQIAEAEARSVEIGQVLSERFARQAEASEAGRRLVDNLVRAEHPVRDAAAEMLRDSDLLEGRAPYLACVVHSREDRIEAVGLEEADAELRRVASDLRSRAGRRVALCGIPRMGELVVLATQSRRDVLLGAFASVAPTYVLGMRAVEALLDVRDAIPDARYAAEVAACVDRFGGVADWSQLGPYAVFQSVERSAAGLERLCPGSAVLWEPGNEMYEETVRVYLAEGGNAQKAAATLHIHRTTLYWRLANIERLLDVVLANGEDRLRLHLALKLSDLVVKRAEGDLAAPRSATARHS
ncbi:PucR family transcriptional regulator [Nocardioides sp. GXZ039]|uniref:PucR family transcriptional regulator n=1 Tax=Nocardioides sp. GXZ039 TaxID=3136018 RepID=UPI0030F4AD0C